MFHCCCRSPSYTVSIAAEGFKGREAKGIVLNSADKRTVSGIQLKPGVKGEVVEVEATGGQIFLSIQEKSILITEKVLQNVAIVGQNAAEFVKIMPGMAFTGGALNQSSYAAVMNVPATGRSATSLRRLAYSGAGYHFRRRTYH